MPFYEYECPHCRAHTEVMQKISDAPLKKCPECGKSGLRKLISAPVFRLKGSGWYETDFKSDKENKRNLAGADRDASPAASDDKAAAAKPAGDKPAGEKAAADKPASDRPGADKPAASKSAGGSKPSGRKPASRKAAPPRAARRKPAARRGGKR